MDFFKISLGIAFHAKLQEHGIKPQNNVNFVNLYKEKNYIYLIKRFKDVHARGFSMKIKIIIASLVYNQIIGYK